MPIGVGMSASELALARGLRDTRRTLADWNASPARVLSRWIAGALIVALGLLAAVWVVARISTPDPTPVAVAGLTEPARLGAVEQILYRNSLVLALHAMACVAGFIAGSALPREAASYSGLWRHVHDRAGPLAIGLVICATTFSLATQAFVLGAGAATLAAQLHTTPLIILLGVTPHALLELTALFLPLAAWIIASRRGSWHELLAATVVTVAIAIPALVVAGFVEVYASPHLLRALIA